MVQNSLFSFRTFNFLKLNMHILTTKKANLNLKLHRDDTHCYKLTDGCMNQCHRGLTS